MLRVNVDGSNYLHLPMPLGGAQYNVYIRFGALSNPLLYNIKFLATSHRVIEVPNVHLGDLVGVYVDWNGNSYDGKSSKLLINYSFDTMSCSLEGH